MQEREVGEERKEGSGGGWRKYVSGMQEKEKREERKEGRAGRGWKNDASGMQEKEERGGRNGREVGLVGVGRRTPVEKGYSA